MLRLCGAELVEVPAVPYANPNNYQHIGRRLADELRKTEPNGVLFADQWNNLDNRKAHYVSTGPGNLAADRRQGRRLHLLHRHRRHARRRVDLPAREEQGHRHRRRRSEGRGDVQPVRARRGQGVGRRLDHRRHRAWPRHPPSSRTSRSTTPYLIPDEEAVPIIFDLLEHEGLCMGGSTGINVAGAIRLAKEHGPGPHHRDHPRRLRHALSVEAVQSGVPAREAACRCRTGWSGARMSRCRMRKLEAEEHPFASNRCPPST